MECPVCKKEFDEYTGRRPKRFCSDECKIKFWNAKKKVAENIKPENKKRIEEERHTPANVGQKHENSQPLSTMEKRLLEIQQEQLKNKKQYGRTV